MKSPRVFSSIGKVVPSNSGSDRAQVSINSPWLDAALVRKSVFPVIHASR